MLTLAKTQWLQMVGVALDAEPIEGCGLLFGLANGDTVTRFVPIRNEAQSPELYRLDEQQYIDAVLAADDDGYDIIGVMHSHTRSAASPSATDIADADRPLIAPNWHWVIVGLAAGYPELRSFRIIEGLSSEEPVTVIG